MTRATDLGEGEGDVLVLVRVGAASFCDHVCACVDKRAAFITSIARLATTSPDSMIYVFRYHRSSTSFAGGTPAGQQIPNAEYVEAEKSCARSIST